MITTKQLSHLQHMGIDVWQRRDGFFDDLKADETVSLSNSEAPLKAVNEAKPQTLDADKTAKANTQASSPSSQTQQDTNKSPQKDSAEQLLNDGFIRDVLLSIGIKATEVEITDLHALHPKLKMGSLVWQLNDNDSVDYRDGILTTPLLPILCQQWHLKRQLWQALCQHQQS
ncbi:DNA polymerase III subunit psi [Thalassotalea maritima]|uniref:DNA polymerase III subunit psi n=1 Tax=Thalassotalea maritima TaxID=3242416 RepID=UPI003526F69C